MSCFLESSASVLHANRCSTQLVFNTPACSHEAPAAPRGGYTVILLAGIKLSFMSPSLPQLKKKKKSLFTKLWSIWYKAKKKTASYIKASPLSLPSELWKYKFKADKLVRLLTKIWAQLTLTVPLRYCASGTNFEKWPKFFWGTERPFIYYIYSGQTFSFVSSRECSAADCDWQW